MQKYVTKWRTIFAKVLFTEASNACHWILHRRQKITGKKEREGERHSEKEGKKNGTEKPTRGRTK